MIDRLLLEGLEVGFRNGFAAGVEHGYLIGTLVAVVVSAITSTFGAWLTRRHYQRQLDSLRERIEAVIHNIERSR